MGTSSKLMSMQEAIGRYVHDEDTIVIEGFKLDPDHLYL